MGSQTLRVIRLPLVIFFFAAAGSLYAACPPVDKIDEVDSTTQLRNGIECYNQGDSIAAYHWWRSSAEQTENSTAMFNLGFLTATGWDQTRADQDAATAWFRKAADLGLPQAQYYLGLRLDQGIGTDQDQVAALGYIYAAADQGLPQAQAELGRRFYIGHGVPKSHLQSYAWIRAAADAGSDLANQFIEDLNFDLTAEQTKIATALANVMNRVEPFHSLDGVR